MQRDRQSIRFRLTVWYGVVLLISLTAFGVGVWVAMRYSLLADLDTELREEAKGLERYLAIETADKKEILSEEMQEFARSLPHDYAVTVQAVGDPEFLINTGVQPSVVAAVVPDATQAAPAGRERFRDINFRDKQYRAFGALVTNEGRQFRVLFAVPAESVDETLERLLFLLCAALPGVVLLAVGGGYWLSGRALRPVDRMTEAARQIGFDNLSARLEVPQTADEIQRLAETWNAMLARIEASVDRMRQFTADASHELRTPIALIRTTAELSLRRTRAPEYYRGALEQIAVETERTTRLLEDLLFLARSDAERIPPAHQRFDLQVALEDAADPMRAAAEAKNLRLELRLPDAPSPIHGDPDAVRRLILILLDNAVKYTPTGGVITAAIHNGPSHVRLTVHDTGMGIAPDALPLVFERFFKEDPSRRREGTGYGLGLAIARAIADEHYAAIDVQSEPGNTTFSVAFPASPERNGAHSSCPEPVTASNISPVPASNHSEDTHSCI